MNERIQKARIALLLDEPFFGSLLMHLKVVESRERKTFCTNGQILQYNPDYLDTLSDDELKTVLAHEVLHCALLHPFRRGERDLKKFNRAADYAINNFLDGYNQEARQKNRTEPFPLTRLNFLLDHSYDNLSAEEIYARLPEDDGGSNQPQPNQGQGQGQGQPQPQPGQGQPTPPQPNGPSGTDQPGDGNGSGDDSGDNGPGEFIDGAADEAQSDEREAEWKVAVKQAALQAKSRGALPAGAARFIEELLNPKVTWREILRRFLVSAAKDDYSFARPNRRYAGNGIILPGLHSPRLGKIIVAVDTSGSIGQKEFDEFIAEVRSILFDCRPESFVLAQCDAALNDWQELDPFTDLQVEFKGGGGTCFKPVFERADQEPLPPVALVYLTDLYGTFPEHPPAYPVLWASTTKDKQAPWGETIELPQ